MRITVGRVDENRVELRYSASVSAMPDWFASGGALGAETIVSVPMTDGAEVPVHGTRLRFARKGSGWTATVLGGFGSEPKLHCSGTVAELGEMFAVFGPGSQASFARARLSSLR